jgi:NADH-quinone oxidoreductase subunit F
MPDGVHAPTAELPTPRYGRAMFFDRLLPADPLASLADYEGRGGGEALARVHDLGADWVIDQLDAAGLRGRGGAGFPAATKWRSVRGGSGDVGVRYAVANGAEGEPGTFKDRPLLQANPYQVLEGLIVAARTIGAPEAYIGMKASFVPEITRVEQAIDEMRDAGWLADLRVYVVKGPDEYLFGEEKGLLEVIEGEEPLPRLFPPYLYGLFATQPQMGWSAAPLDSEGEAGPVSNPTLVNNVETLANVPLILANGPEWYRRAGTAESPGTIICTVSGDTIRAGYAEVAMGTPLRAIVDEVGGGVAPDRSVKGVLSGVANPVVTSENLDVPLSYEGFTAIGSGLGAAGFLVFDDRRDMVRVAHAVSRFLYVESCGQCPACKFGTGEVTARLGQLIIEGGSPQDLETIAARLRSVTDANRCYLGAEEQQTVSSLLAAYPEDVALNLTGVQTDPVEPISKIVDIVDGVAVVDDKQAYKQPDWTYAGTPVAGPVSRTR